MTYNPKQDWELIKTRSVGKEGTVFTFRTLESREQGEYNVSYRMIADRVAKTEEEAWLKLKEPWVKGE